MTITNFIFIATGSFAIWLAKGLKGSFNNEMVSVDERSSTKGTLRFLLGVGIWMVVVLLLTIILAKPTEKKIYKGRLNEKGEIELDEIK